MMYEAAINIHTYASKCVFVSSFYIRWGMFVRMCLSLNRCIKQHEWKIFRSKLFDDRGYFADGSNSRTAIILH